MASSAASAAARVGARGQSKSEVGEGPRRSTLGLLAWLSWQPLRLLALLILRGAVWAYRSPGRAGVLALAVLVALGSGYYLWFRNSSFVSIERIQVEGTTIQIDEINTALAAAAAGMTTLNADAGALEDALARFPTVAGVELSADFPHDLTVTVIEQPPVAVISTGDRLIAVDGEGRVLDGIAASELAVPRIEAESVPSTGIQGDALQQVEVLNAAPPPLQPLVEESRMESGQVTLVMQGGVELRFGPAQDLERKWAAAAAVLADPKLVQAQYVDLRIPARPAVGGDPTNPVVPEEPEPST